MEYKSLRVMISGGGTGGHIFPAVSIADKLKQLNPETEILFVGAEGKMEMEKVPAAGYRIVGLPIVGLQRQLNFKNIINDLMVPFKLLASIVKARKTIKEFKPQIVVGVGGYASAPLLWVASGMGIPCLIQEQNGFAGLTNEKLGSRVSKICVAYEGMERFFPADKIVMTGNPIRSIIVPCTQEMKEAGVREYGLDPSKKHIFIVGGSLGSSRFNQSMRKWIEDGCPGGEGVDVLWQCGKYYKAGVDQFMAAQDPEKVRNIHHSDFIAKMDLAYAAADVVISRSGASSVSELCTAHKATVFIPSPNVAEDHQTHNAMALVRKDAAVLVKDSDAMEKMMSTALELLKDPERIASIEENAGKMALPDAAQKIAEEVYGLV
ncbi:MAG: undecaprenyldiphospho-muramoylpentapeptide beta-N-acetylglucosaminyltransferase [Bacteroidales bacterium]|nr:undecaprenyldiphospho-muramoylpentapeptide beta-N-acetylglucosaminyltransferase [Candidatus Cryptobacteroides faecihippi]